MASVFKAAGAKKYTIQYVDERGKTRKAPGTPDKAITQRIANEIENQVALRRAGLINPADEAYAKHEVRPLADHVADFRRTLEDKGGKTKKHPMVAANRINRLLNSAKARRISELSISAIRGAMAKLRSEGFSQGTVNQYTIAIKSFSKWLWQDKRARAHALVSRQPSIDG